MTINNHKRASNRRTIILMLVLSILPVVLAGLYYVNPQWISRYKNYGTLISPPIQLPTNALSAFGEFSKQHFTELDDRWLLIHIVPEHIIECDQASALAIYNSHQLWLMMNQNLMRLRRVVVFASADIAAQLEPTLAIEDEYLLYAVGEPLLFNQLSNIVPTSMTVGTLLLRDPLVNIMLWEEPDFDVYKVKKDLSRLFRTSRIG
jgi:hypothetical protein